MASGAVGEYGAAAAVRGGNGVDSVPLCSAVPHEKQRRDVDGKGLCAGAAGGGFLIWFSRWRKPKRPDPSQPLEAQLAQLREHLQVLERQQYQLAQNLADALQDSQFIAQQISARLLNVPKAQRWWYGE